MLYECCLKQNTYGRKKTAYYRPFLQNKYGIYLPIQCLLISSQHSSINVSLRDSEKCFSGLPRAAREKDKLLQDRGHQWSTRPASSTVSPVSNIIFTWNFFSKIFKKWIRTTLMKIIITTGGDWVARVDQIVHPSCNFLLPSLGVSRGKRLFRNICCCCLLIFCAEIGRPLSNFSR